MLPPIPCEARAPPHAPWGGAERRTGLPGGAPRILPLPPRRSSPRSVARLTQPLLPVSNGPGQATGKEDGTSTYSLDAKKMNQKALATAINEKPQVIGEYESGKAVPNPQIISKIERTLGCKLPKPPKKKKPKK